MKVLLDGKPVTSSGPTLADAIEAGRSAAQSMGRVIVEAKRNGLPIADAELESPAARPEPDATIEFGSADARALVRQTFLDVAAGLDECAEAQRQAAEAFQIGKISDALKQLTEALGLWQTVQRVVQDGPRLLGRDPETVTVEVEGERLSISAIAGTLLGRLAELKRTLESEDWAALADLLLYDMADEVEKWRTILTGLAGRTATL